ncbi:MAG: DUF1402 family protein [Bdellovibrionaceae bacterium]|nr:DUF1402 family protein [Pseudobdellovibrionaceae bacterium]
MKLLLCLFFWLFIPFKGSAAVKKVDFSYLIPAQQPSIDQVCRLDTENCDKLSRPVNKEALFLIQKHKAWILYLGHKYKVQPTLIASIFLAEQSLIFGLYDVLQNILASWNIEITSSVGPLQVSALAVRISENLLSKLDHRKPVSKKVLQKKLLNIKSALYYATGYLLHIQNVYKKQGLDISNSFGLIGTLYTLGSVQKRAKQTKKLNRPMRVSYYGYFIEKNKSTVQKILYP